jgi:site-specific DNA-cytosine methylase
MSHVYLAGRRCAKGQWRETLRKLGISTRAVPEIQFVGTSIVDLWVYAQHAPQIRERLAASGFKFEQFEPTSPSAIARPDLSVTSRAKHAQAAYLNRLQRTVEACTNESVRSHAEVLIRSLNPDSRSPPRVPTTVDDNPSTETASSTVPGSADNTPADCDMEI